MGIRHIQFEQLSSRISSLPPRRRTITCSSFYSGGSNYRVRVYYDEGRVNRRSIRVYLVNVGLFSGPLQLRLFGASDCLELTRRERILCIYGYPRCTRAHLLFKNSNARQWLLSRLFWECSTSARLLVPWSCCLIDIYLDLVVNGIVSGLVNNPIG